MLDLSFVRDHLPLVEEKLRQRGLEPGELLGRFKELDSARRQAITRAETLAAERKRLAKGDEIFGSAAKNLSGGAPQTAQLEARRQMRAELEELEKKAQGYDEELRTLLSSLPNLPHESVPIGKTADDNAEIRRWGSAPKFDFAPKPHWELGEQLGILDLPRAAKLSGARFAVYWDMGAKLERALASFMLDLHAGEHGYVEVLPPYLVNAKSMYGTGQLPKFERDLFKVPHGFAQDKQRVPRVGELVGALGKNELFVVAEVHVENRTADIRLWGETEFVDPGIPWGALFFAQDLYLIPTAEVPLTNLYRDEVIDAARLPLSLTAYTPCFRSEAGSHGKDVRGIIRQHQFQKVELVKFARPDDSYEQLEKLTRNAETVLQRLGLHYRTVELCTGDLGANSAKTYDIEVWLPGQQLFREISSCSNFEAFQARRANIRWKPDAKGKSEFVHTINGSGLAIGRTWVAIVENYQQADGSVVVPEALRPYVGAERITARKF